MFILTESIPFSNTVGLVAKSINHHFSRYVAIATKRTVVSTIISLASCTCFSDANVSIDHFWDEAFSDNRHALLIRTDRSRNARAPKWNNTSVTNN